MGEGLLPTGCGPREGSNFCSHLQRSSVLRRQTGAAIGFPAATPLMCLLLFPSLEIRGVEDNGAPWELEGEVKGGKETMLITPIIHGLAVGGVWLKYSRPAENKCISCMQLTLGSILGTAYGSPSTTRARSKP